MRKLIADVSANGAGHNYLIQHSAGSGKSNSIAWTAYRLASLHDKDNNAIFSSVIVVTDRTVLDAQLQETISSFDHTLGAVETIGEDKTSRDLRDAINAGVRIIVTTLQKFPVIYQEVDAAHGRNYAIIVDEAHSSQTGSSALKLKAALADTEEALREYAEIEGKAEDEIDPEDKLVREMIVHGRHKNLSFFAFTATPKGTTLEMFGTEYDDGSFHPFHIYSMRQAIEEGFILDVLQNYMTYDTCFRIAKTTADNPDVPGNRAAKVIRRFEQLHPYNISQKAQIIVETFMGTTRHKIGGRGKMMVITSSRLAAVRYYHECKRYIEEKGYNDVGVLVAFSGAVQDGDEEYTEPKLNTRKDGSHIGESQTKAEFHDNFHVLIAEITSEVNNGVYIEPDDMTLAQWLEIWQESYLIDIKPSTYAQYDYQIRVNIIPNLGRFSLQKITPPMIQTFYNQMVKPRKIAGKNGKKVSRKGLSAKSVKNVHGVLHKAFQQAVLCQYIRTNPCDACRLPRAEKAKTSSIQGEEVSAFLEAIKGDPYERLYFVTLFTGMRQGEIIGLTWDCVDFDKGIIRVEKQLRKDHSSGSTYEFSTLKNGKTRTITPAPVVFDVLRKVKAEQAGWKLAAGEAFRNDKNLVFTNELGEHLTSVTVYNHLKRILDSIGLGHIRFHDLRHSFATLSIQNGDDIKTVSENLGHATVAFTLDVYGHVTDKMKKDSADRMQAFIDSL